MNPQQILTFQTPGPATGTAALPVTKAAALVALRTLREFIGPAQMRVIKQAFRGEECQFFFDKAVQLAGIVNTMPQTYQQEGQDDPMVYFHYFTGGCTDVYITEKDIGSADEPGQHQAFGLVDHGHGGELGYISLVEILQCGTELDLYFTPSPLSNFTQ